MIYIEQSYNETERRSLIGIMYKEEDISKEDINKIKSKIKNALHNTNLTVLLRDLKPQILIKSYQRALIELLKMVKQEKIKFIYKTFEGQNFKDIKTHCLELLDVLNSRIPLNTFNCETISLGGTIKTEKLINQIYCSFKLNISVKERQSSNGLKIADNIAYIINHQEKNKSFYDMIKSNCEQI